MGIGDWRLAIGDWVKRKQTLQIISSSVTFIYTNFSTGYNSAS
ncbi:MAG: hypothetical protein ACFKPT_14730 [Gloeotrichia echinulata GP01]